MKANQIIISLVIFVLSALIMHWFSDNYKFDGFSIVEKE